MSRKLSRRIKRVIVKIGSSVMVDYQLKPQRARLYSLVKQISQLRKQGIEVILVSSGAIVFGMGELGLRSRPSDLAQLQANAAVGQNILMRTYSELFKKNNLKCAQVLLTWDDFADRTRFNNARTTLQAILDYGAIPVINENDTISTQEIKFGDNDQLSALVASMMHADLLMILSDVEGLYDYKNGRKEVLSEIKEITKEVESIASGTNKKQISKGGMVTKLGAIKIATHADVPCVIASGEAENVLLRIIKGERLGTFFAEKEEKLLAAKHWISFIAKPKGTIVIDDGAREAVLTGGKSLLLPGVVGWEGHFKVDDVVIVTGKDDQEIARGLTNYSFSDLHKTEDKKQKKEVIHRDNLVLCKR
ncbi:MAG: glutamate 5-kinase [Candidatus Omnitrophota bacterium]